MVAPATLGNYETEVKHLTASCAVIATGTLVASQGQGQSFEIQASSIEVTGWVEDPETYPIQPKAHSLEFLREVAHLRPRTNLFGAVTRIRHTHGDGDPSLLRPSRASTGSTRRSSRPRTPKAPGRCSASPRWT